MMFVRTEREGDCPIYLFAANGMLPYCFAAGHMNYSRYRLCYFWSMKHLPKEELERFLKGEHVTRQGCRMGCFLICSSRPHLCDMVTDPGV